VLPTVRSDEQFRTALPVYDLAEKVEGWGRDVTPSVKGWAQVRRGPLDSEMFVGKVVGRSMEPGIPDGAWGLFRTLPVGAELTPTTLDGRRVLARLRAKLDPETGSYTIKRWKVTRVGPGGEALEITLWPDNKALKPIVVTLPADEVQVLAEYLETVG